MDVVEIRSSIEIFSAAVLPPNLTRDTKRDMVGDDRDVNRALQFPILEPPVCTLNIATQIIDWGLWTDQHRAAPGIASEERAEEGSVGKECVSTSRYRWTPVH